MLHVENCFWAAFVCLSPPWPTTTPYGSQLLPQWLSLVPDRPRRSPRGFCFAHFATAPAGFCPHSINSTTSAILLALLSRSGLLFSSETGCRRSTCTPIACRSCVGASTGSFL